MKALPKSHLIAGLLYAIVALASGAVGVVYLLSRRFMPYHEAAIGIRWQDLSPPMQALILAFMRSIAAGDLALAFALLTLLLGPFQRGALWSRRTIPFLILVFYANTLYATLALDASTPADAPWWLNALACALALAGWAIDGFGLRETD